MILTAGTAVDCTQGRALIEGFTAECLLADKGYDTKLCWAWKEVIDRETTN